MKSFAIALLISATSAVRIAKEGESPILHPDTGLAVTTTGFHWYGQEPLALA